MSHTKSHRLAAPEQNLAFKHGCVWSTQVKKIRFHIHVWISFKKNLFLVFGFFFVEIMRKWKIWPAWVQMSPW